MLTSTTEHVGVLQAFRRAVAAVLEAHGERWTERSQLVVNARPGILTLSEADDDAGAVVRLALIFDDRDEAAFGTRLEVCAAGDAENAHR